MIYIYIYKFYFEIFSILGIKCKKIDIYILFIFFFKNKKHVYKNLEKDEFIY